MNKYDAMYIVAPTVDEEARKALIAEINAIFTSRGTKEVLSRRSTLSSPSAMMSNFFIV